MGSQTFRSRWVARWGVFFGSLCLAVSLVLFVAATQAQERSDAAQEESERNQKACADQATGGSGDGSVCAQIAGAGVNEAVKGYVAAAVLAVLGVSQLAGAFRIGVTFTGPGIILRNPLRTHRIRWDDIERFAIDSGQTGPLSYAFGRVDLVDGTSHRIEAVCAMPWEHKSTFRDARVLDALNDELAARRGQSPDVSAPDTQAGTEANAAPATGSHDASR